MAEKIKLWTDEDELGYQIGDMHGEWQRGSQTVPFKPEQKGKSVPVIRLPKPENQKKHIKKDGK